MNLPNFSKLFEDNRELVGDWGRVTLRVREAGELVITSGSVVACDPLTEPEEETGAEVFTRQVPAGRHPVTLSVAHFEDGDQRVAAALVTFAPGVSPSRWEMALLRGEDVAELEEGEVFGYPVESGTGCFMDERAARLFEQRAEADESFIESLVEALERNYTDTWSRANLALDEETGANLVAFSAGNGDGLYASYFGLDEAGECVCLVTDFSIFELDEIV